MEFDGRKVHSSKRTRTRVVSVLFTGLIIGSAFMQYYGVYYPSVKKLEKKRAVAAEAEKAAQEALGGPHAKV